MSGASGKKILLIDDDEALRHSLSEQLRLHEEFDTAEAATGAEGIEKAKAEYYDLILLDVGLPDMDGREVCRLMRRGAVKSPIIMLTAAEAEADTILALDAGANDYVTKPFSPRELAARVNALLGRIRQRDEVAGQRRDVGGLVLDPDTRSVTISDRRPELTKIEFDLLDALSARPGSVLSRGTLLQEVWGDDYVGDDHVVDVHIANLRKKIEDGPPSRIRTVRGVGYAMAV